MEGHAETCVHSSCEVASKSVSQLKQVDSDRCNCSNMRADCSECLHQVDQLATHGNQRQAGVLYMLVVRTVSSHPGCARSNPQYLTTVLMDKSFRWT